MLGDVQREVYKRYNEKCTQCGSLASLHFDHIIPFSKGGSSKVASNIQLLCAKNNLHEAQNLHKTYTKLTHFKNSRCKHCYTRLLQTGTIEWE